MTRRLITVAVSAYPDAGDTFTKAIQDQVAVIERWVISAADPFTHEPVEPGTDKPRRRLKVLAADLDDLGPDDVLFVYVTGHGEPGTESRRHRLLLPDGTLFETAELVDQTVGSGAGHVAVLVDSCHAGTLYTEVDKLLQDRRADSQQLPRSCCVVVSGHPDQPTRLREFGRLIERVLDLLRSDQFAPPAGVAYLSPQQFHDALREVASDEKVKPQWVWPRSLDVDGEPCRALPNPAYAPHDVLTGAAVQDLSLTAGQVRGYWTEKASGRTSEDDPGWYFRGREVLMRDVVDFLDQGRAPTPPAGLLVVTGEAGSGKSAVIARAVTLADPAFRANPEFAALVNGIPPGLRPMEGTIDAAIAARGLSAERIATELATALASTWEHSPSDPATASLRHRVVQAVQQARHRHGRPVTVVIDGVDEATNPATVLTEVIAPLTTAWTSDATPVARVVVGIRSERTADPHQDDAPGTGLLATLHLAAHPVEVTLLRTDGPDARPDITAYVTAVLLTDSSPYAGDPAAAQAAAEVVAAHVTPRFLDARVAAAALRDAPTRQDLDDPVWLSHLAEGSVAQLRADLLDVAQDAGRPWAHLMAVLRAAALAQGAGLPWANIWPTVAVATYGDPPEQFPDPNEAIRDVLGSRLSGYLLTTAEDGRRVWRPSHERLTETLRDHPQRLLPHPPSPRPVDDPAVTDQGA